MGVNGPAGVGGEGLGAGLGAMTPKAHSPVAKPPTVLGDPPESPYWAAGEFPVQRRFPAIWLVRNSLPSGSPSELPLKVALPPMWLRKLPSQHELSPVTRRLPAMVLSS